MRQRHLQGPFWLRKDEPFGDGAEPNLEREGRAMKENIRELAQENRADQNRREQGRLAEILLLKSDLFVAASAPNTPATGAAFYLNR